MKTVVHSWFPTLADNVGVVGVCIRRIFWIGKC